MNNQPTEKNFGEAVALLRAGELVAFPTETVYGLGADAANPTAVARIYAAKRRPTDHPVIVHLASTEQLPEWAREVSDTAWQLAKHFWPGPLTLILPRAMHVSPLITGGQDSIGLRIPSHPVAQKLLKDFGDGIAAPSANRFGRLSPTQATHVQQELGDAVALILDGGECEVGIESTIIDLSHGHPHLIRPGLITASEVSAVLNTSIDLTLPPSLRAPGTLNNHYAPVTPLYLVQSNLLMNIATQLANPNHRLAILAHSISPPPPIDPDDFVQDILADAMDWITLPDEPRAYAHALYDSLREFDHQNYLSILVEDVPTSEPWLAVRDRLQRAASRLITSDAP